MIHAILSRALAALEMLQSGPQVSKSLGLRV